MTTISWRVGFLSAWGAERGFAAVDVAAVRAAPSDGVPAGVVGGLGGGLAGARPARAAPSKQPQPLVTSPAATSNTAQARTRMGHHARATTRPGAFHPVRAMTAF